MPQVTRHSRPAEETIDETLIEQQLRLDDLQRHLALQDLVASTVHDGEATVADVGDDLVLPGSASGSLLR